MPRLSFLPYVVLTALMGIAQLSPETLMYQREALEAGQLWRWWTAHFTHQNNVHYLLNMVGFWLWLYLQNPLLSTTNLLGLLVVFSSGISGLLWLYNPQLQWYLGFSGILYGLYMLWGLQCLFGKERWLGFSVVILLVTKTLWDLSQPNVPHRLIDIPIIYHAHLYGIILAPLSLGLLRLREHEYSLPRSKD